jgi:peptide/nickel transport system substrate-binding protein
MISSISFINKMYLFSKILIPLSILFIIIVGGCKKIEPQSKPKVFHYNQVNYLTSLDPAFAKTQNNMWVIDHLFNQLIDLNDSLQLSAEIAYAWEISDDALHYTFHLRQDIFYQRDACFKSDSTRKLIASDCVYSLSRLIDPKVNSPGSWIFNERLDSINPFESPNDSTFIIHLKKPFTPLLQMLTMQYCSIIPRESAEYYRQDLSKHPVGTGPFQLKKWLDRRGIFLRKNPIYFKKGLPLLDGVRISFMEDRNTAYLEFLKNEIDFFSGLQAGFARQLIDENGFLREDRKEQINFLKGNFLNSEYIGINMSMLDPKHPLHDKRVRQALNFAIDRKTMLRLLKFGVGNPALHGFIPDGLSIANDSMMYKYSYNPDSARSLLKSAGYENKENFPELVIATNKDYVDLMTFVARQWEEIGIPVRIDLVETATLREKMRLSELLLFRASWIADYPDEESFLNVFYSKNPAPPNYTRYNNPLFDQLYDKAIREPAVDIRLTLYKQMNELIMEDAPVIFLFYDQTAWFVQQHIQNLKSNSLNLLRLENVDKIIN